MLYIFRILILICLFPKLHAEEDIYKEIKILFQTSKVSPIIEKTPINNSFFILVNDKPYIYFKNENYAVQSDSVYDPKTKETITSKILLKNNKRLINEYTKEFSTITYKSKNEKHFIYVFTDPTCPYCQALDNNKLLYNKAGISLVYIPFPRNGLSGTPYNSSIKKWCTEKPTNCALAVKKGYRLGKKINITSTPSFVLNNGRVLKGFKTPKTLLKEFK